MRTGPQSANGSPVSGSIVRPLEWHPPPNPTPLDLPDQEIWEPIQWSHRLQRLFQLRKKSIGRNTGILKDSVWHHREMVIGINLMSSHLLAESRKCISFSSLNSWNKVNQTQSNHAERLKRMKPSPASIIKVTQDQLQQYCSPQFWQKLC